MSWQMTWWEAADTSERAGMLVERMVAATRSQDLPHSLRLKDPLFTLQGTMETACKYVKVQRRPVSV